jgi:hypothetical protein
LNAPPLGSGVPRVAIVEQVKVSARAEPAGRPSAAHARTSPATDGIFMTVSS